MLGREQSRYHKDAAAAAAAIIAAAIAVGSLKGAWKWSVISDCSQPIRSARSPPFEMRGGRGPWQRDRQHSSPTRHGDRQSLVNTVHQPHRHNKRQPPDKDRDRDSDRAK